LEGKKATCYPGFEEYLTGATVGGRVRVDGKIITACGMGAAIEFGLAIVEELKGKALAQKIKDAVLAR
jgi:4-methyl-5(b-hydroxyethyl)-thiazole monophosphate biosynthesis